MSETSALNGRVAEGATTVRDAGLQGMITLRGNLASTKLKAICKEITGQAMPKAGQAHLDGGTGLAWMSPDELLLLVPHGQVAEVIARIDAALAGQHYLAVNVSDARALIAVEGSGAREVIARLCPVDMAPEAFGPGDFRRTRMAQIPAAFWMEQDGSLRVICFRSVAEYAFGLLSNAATSPAVGCL